MKDRLIKKHNKLIWLELLLLAGWIFLMQFYISPGAFVWTIKHMILNPALLLLNLLPIAVVLLIVYFLCSNSFIAGAITNIVFGLMSYANLLKIEGRDDPFVPADIALLREALDATGEYRLDMHFGIVALILISTAVFVLLGIYLGRTQNRGKKGKVIGIIACACVFVASFFAAYDSAALYEKFPTSMEYNVTASFNELGFNYCFLHNVNLYGIDKPEGYSASEIEGCIGDFSPAEPDTVKPQILTIMCEAFSDLNDGDAFTYTEEESPLHCYHLVRDSANCISGEIVVPNFGAGTANTEFDVITGMQTNLISDTSNSALRTFHKDIPSSAQVLKANGYDTYYMHPGLSWFYNRDSAMSHMGFDEKEFVDDFEDKSGLDTVYLEELINQLDARTANGEKLFTYSTTIQNHQAYVYSKYDFEIPKVKTSMALSPEAEEFLSVYTYGIKCSSEMLYELTEYLNSLTEPYMLVFFGDHLPALGADFLSYKEIGLDIGENGTPEQLVSSCTVPYIIWINDAYKNSIDFEKAVNDLELPADGRISACFLGEVALELAGFDEADAYYSFLGELRRELPVIKAGIVGTPDGVLTDELSEEQAALVDKLHDWQYYRLKTEKIS